jgi:UDP-glucose 4-epimerase
MKIREYLMSKKIAVVTGGAGFIGSHLVDLLLSEGFEVRVIDNFLSGRLENLAHLKGESRLSVVEIDIRDLPSDHAAFRDASYVFHLAGIGDIVPSIEKPVEYMAINVQGTVRVLEAARYNNVSKLVYAASSSCYGLADVPTKETAPIAPQYPYALSKYQGEQAVFHWGKVYKVPVNSIRIFNAYGTRSRTTGAYGAVFGVFLKQKIAGQPYTVVGDGSQSRDFIYVTDVARAFYMAAKTQVVGECFNVGASNPQSVNRLIEILGGEKIHIPKRPGEPDSTWADTTKIRTMLGWEPLLTFEEGVSKMLDQLDYWKNAPLWTPDSIRNATKLWFSSLSN